MRDPREKWSAIRIRMIGGIFLILFAAVAVRSVYLQLVKRSEWTRLAKRQHQRVVPLTPARGTIADRSGAELAVSINIDSCFAEPNKIVDKAGTAAKLAPILGIPRDQLIKKLDTSRHFVWLQRHMNPDLVDKVKSQGLNGIGFVKETRRYYPNSELACHVLGFTGLDPEGLDGVELKYNSTLLGNTGYLITERDALGRDVVLKGVSVKEGSKGHNLALTLDKNIQYIAEKELNLGVAAAQAKGGTVLVMEPQTGMILALCNYPPFNPNAGSRYSRSALRNQAVSDSFEPGSTMKVFLIAAALEEKAITSRDSFNCENGSYAIGGKVIHDTHKYSRLTVPEILKYSSNIGAAKIGFKLGKEQLYTYLRNFGMGQKTGIDLPGEATGLLRDRNRWFPVDFATISFGQGMTTTSLQLTAAMTAIANGGVLMKPYVVDRVTDQEGNVLQQFSPQPVRRVISPETAREVRRMMEGVTDQGGTGTNAALEGFKVAGKTGTAQKVDEVTKTYSIDKRTASFIGFVPADKPKLVITVIIDEPKTSTYGGVVAAPVFSAIAAQSLSYLKVAPPSPAKPKIIQTATKPKEVITPATEGAIISGDEGAVMPDFRGLSMREVLRAMERQGLNVKLVGSGKAVAQNPQPGQTIRAGDQVWVKFGAMQ